MSAGGDQGRDFETYETQLPGQVQGTGRELGISDRAMVGFGCTLQQSKIGTKVRSDVRKIMSEGKTASFIVYYCEVDIPVARRHALEKEIKEECGIRVSIFDGNAIAELLTDHANFWIAETYLHVPSRILPPPSDRPGWYEQDLTRWKNDEDAITTIGQLVDIAGCLHYACSANEGLQDIPFWLHKLEPLLTEDTPKPLRRRVRYQVIAAHTKGLDSLWAVDHLAEEVLEEASSEVDPTSLSDASTVLAFVIGAKAQGTTAHSVDRIARWSEQLAEQIRKQLESESLPGEICILLETLAMVLLQPDLLAIEAIGVDVGSPDDPLPAPTFRESVSEFRSGLAVIDSQIPLVNVVSALEVLSKLLIEMESAPLFPTETASELLRLYAPWLIDVDGYNTLTSAFDERVAQLSGSEAAADRALDRAATLFAAGRTLEGLRHLHRVRMGLFQGASRVRMISATLATASAYEELRLYAAAKYFGLVAARLSGRDHLEQHSQGLVRAAFADYHQGNWVNAVHLNCAALESHFVLVEQPDDFRRHSWLTGTFFELTQIRALASKLGEPYSTYVDSKISGVGAESVLQDLLAGALKGRTPWWEALSPDEHVETIASSLGRPPFSDAVNDRQLRFECLGVTWVVEFANTYRENAVGERFSAALQIVLAYIALEHDPVFLPTSISILVETGDSPDVSLMSPSPVRECRLKVVLSEINSLGIEGFSETGQTTLAAVAQVILTVATIDDESFSQLLHDGLEEGLMSLVVFGVPYDIAWRDSVSALQFDAFPQDEQALVVSDRLTPRVHSRLDAPTTKGPGYDQVRSHQEIAHRYQDLPPRIGPTMEMLQRNEQFAATIALLRGEGWLDWHLVVAVHSVARNARLSLQPPRSQAEMDALRASWMEPEPAGDPVPIGAFTVEALRLAYALSTSTTATNWWSMTLRQQPLDSAALHQLLVTRYGWAEDDVEHSDPFEARPKR